MTSIPKLQRHWQDWGVKLEPLVKSKSARLDFPAKLKQVEDEEDYFVVAPERPICITNAPMKASSSRLRKNSPLAIFIGGDLRVSKNPNDPCITHSCNLTIFKYTETPHVSASFEMVDAMHFDVDAIDKDTGLRTPFHPIFHVQRGTSHEDNVFKTILSEILHIEPGAIEVQTNKNTLGSPYLRVPTPQLDMFSVFTLIAADYFCNPGDAEKDVKHDRAAKDGKKVNPADRTNVTEQFVGLLELLKSSANVAREGKSSIELRDRLNKGKMFNTGYWYPESA